MLLMYPRNETGVRSERARETRVGQGRLEERDVSEGRIAEHHVVRPGGPLLEKTEDVRTDDFRLRVESCRSDVLSQRLQRFGRTLDERRVCRPARERLDTQRSRSREQVEHARVLEDRLEDREERLTDPVGRRPR